MADPVASGPQPGAGVATGGALAPALPYGELKQTWAEPAQVPRADTIDITATNLATVTIDVARARVGCGVRLNVTGDGPLAVTLTGCGRVVRAG